MDEEFFGAVGSGHGFCFLRMLMIHLGLLCRADSLVSVPHILMERLDIISSRRSENRYC